MTIRYDVIVIGAGPAGSMAARTLARKGKSVLLLERGSFPGREKACGGMLPYRVFAEFGLGEDLIETKMNHEVMVFPWFRRITSQPTVTVSRRVFDEHLARSVKQAGGHLVTSCRVTGILRQACGQVKVMACSDRGQVTFESRLVIFADGVNSLAHRTMGIGFRRGDNLAFGLEYTFEAPGNRWTDYYLFFDLNQLAPIWGYAWIFPNKHSLNAGVFMPPDKLRGHPHKHRLVEYHVDNADTEFARLLRGKKLCKKIGAYIPLEVATRFCDDSALVVGDAAGLVFPLTAGGLYIALQSGQSAVLVADQALSTGDVSRQGMLAYEQEMVGTVVYRDMRRQFQLFQFCKGLGRFDPQLYAKLFHLYKLKSELPLSSKLKVAAYPLTGNLGHGAS